MLGRLAVAYRTAAILLLNTLLLLIFINLPLYIFQALVDQQRGVERESAGSLQYGDERLVLAYPTWSKTDRDQLLTETWTRPYVCSPFVHYQERPFAGQFVNVDAAGFRWNATALPFPPDPTAFNIFVFGGSTTFGYGVADFETIPHYLQEQLTAEITDRPVHVYNFGAGAYYSTLELILFEKLLRAGHHPDLAIFIDGMNEGQNAPSNWQNLACNTSPEPNVDWNQLPLKRAADSVSYRARRLLGTAEEEPIETPLTSPDDLSPEKEQAALEQWLVNRQMIQALATTFEVKLLFVWQPDPRYHYDRQYHLFNDRLPVVEIDRQVLMAERRSEWETWEDFLYLADLQANRQENLYVDALHYSSAFNEEIAQAIVDALLERQLVPIF